MLIFTALISTALAAPASAAEPPQPSLVSLVAEAEGNAAEARRPATVSKQIDFLGFSVDETVSVWHVEYSREHLDGPTKVRDSFGLIRLVDADTRAIMASFRATEVRRKRLAGPARRFRRSEIEGANPEWVAAQPRKQWLKFRRKVKLVSERVAMNDSALRLYTDDDTDPSLQANEDVISALGSPGEAVGFIPIARLMDGSYMNLGHFRVQGIAGVVQSATVEVFRSRTARHLAVICRFFREDRPDAETHMATVTATGKEAYATNTVGAVEMLKIETRQGGEIFTQQFPDLKNMYEFYVGRTWF